MVALSRIGIEIDTTDLGRADINIRALGNAIGKLDRRKRKLDTTTGFSARATAKLKRVVFTIAMNVAFNLYDNTPIGDNERIKSGEKEGALALDQRYFEMYKRRNSKYGIPMQAGYHAGAYSYSESKIPKLSKSIRTKIEMMNEIKKNFIGKDSKYQLGDKFFIAAKGPAYRYMQKGDIGTGDGIIQPTVESIMRSYSSQIRAAYNKRGDYAYTYP